MNPLEKRLAEIQDAKTTIKALTIVESFQELTQRLGATPDETYEAAKMISVAVLMQRNVLAGGDLNDLSEYCIEFANVVYELSEKSIESAQSVGLDLIKLGKAFKKNRESDK